jgi:succinoglycan biosynthesis transport protein ExoP
LVSTVSDEPNIGRALGFLRRRGLWIVLCVGLSAVGAFAFSRSETKKYTATASLVFDTNQITQQIAGLSTSGSSQLLLQANNIELVHLGPMADETAAAIGEGLTAAAVDGSLAISGQTESSVVGISATATSARLAADIANTYAQDFVDDQTKANRQFFRSALALVRRQLGRLSPVQRLGEDGLALQDRAQSLALLSELQPNTVRVAQEAAAPTVPSSPRTSRNVVIGGLLGLVVGVGVALLLERIDPRIRGLGELEAIYGVPLLGVIPRSAELPCAEDADSDLPLAPSSGEEEAFHMIRANLRSYNPGCELRTVLIASAAKGEGKTTVAYHLAAAAARTGLRVLLLEVDLRCPRLARQLGVRSQVGLSDVLVGTVDAEDATHTIEMSMPWGGSSGAGRLAVLTAGSSVSANPVELIESDAMAAILMEATVAYDLVVVDAPELNAVSDAHLLLPKVDGIIIVSDVTRGRRDVAGRLRQVLDTSRAPLLGVIATGASRRRGASDIPLHPGLWNNYHRGLSNGNTAAEDEFAPSGKA